MKVKLKLLATYRNVLPPEAAEGEIVLSISGEVSANDLVKRYGIPADESSVILVNGLTPKPGDYLRDGDTVFVFPAIAGGRF
jgi:molybdopterin converting factor small subunit